MSDTEPTNPEITSDITQPATVEADEDLSSHKKLADAVRILQQDKQGLDKFNDVNISMCRAFQVIFRECALTTFIESKNILETSFDGGPSRITPEEKSILQSVINGSVRNYTTLWYIANTCENLLLEFRRGLTSNFATLSVLLYLLASAAATSTCPTFTNADIVNQNVNYHTLTEINDACTRKHTTKVEQRFYLAAGQEPKLPDLSSSTNTKLSYAYLKGVFEATNSIQNLRNPRLLESILQTRASSTMKVATNMFSKVKGTILQKYDVAANVKVAAEDALSPVKGKQTFKKIFDTIKPTQVQEEEAMDLLVRTSKNKNSVKEQLKSNATTVPDTVPYHENLMVHKVIEELFNLDFTVSCQFIADNKEPYISCEYSLIGASIDYSTIDHLLESLIEKTKSALLSHNVTGIEQASDTVFLRIMVEHYSNSNVLALGDLYTALIRVKNLVSKMDTLVTNGKLFRQIVKQLYMDLSPELVEQLMTATGAPYLIDEGFDPQILFQGVIGRVISHKEQKQAIRDLFREEGLLKKALHELGIMYKESIKEFSPEMGGFLNTIVTEFFQTLGHAVTVTGNTTRGVLDDVGEFTLLSTHFPVSLAQSVTNLQIAASYEAEQGIRHAGQANTYYWKTYGSATVFCIIFAACYYINPHMVSNLFHWLIQGIRGVKDVSKEVRSTDNQPVNKGDNRPEIQNEFGNTDRRLLQDAMEQQNRVERGEISSAEAKAMIEARTGAARRNNFFVSPDLTDYRETGNLSIAKTADIPKGIQIGDIVSGTGRNRKLYTGPFYGGGAKTRKHKKRIGAASKHHKKRRRGTKKPSKRIRATRRKRR